MAELSVVVVAPDRDQRQVLQLLVDGSGVAQTVHACASYPVVATDAVTRRVQSAAPSVIVIDVADDNVGVALQSIELLRQELPDSAIFAVGRLSQPQTIVNAMRAGAREFIQRPATTTDLLEAFVRLTAAQRKAHRQGSRGKVFTIINAKGGNGATTVAVNLALALNAAHGSTALIDIAPLGHAALHLNLKPVFGVADAIRNLHRLDSSLLESFITRHTGGLRLLAGAGTPQLVEPTTAEFARLFDLLVSHYRYVIVDASSRLDPVTRLICNLSEDVLLVAQTEVASLWSAARIHQYLLETGGRERIHLLLNRFRKTPGFSEADAERAAGVKILAKIPNQYFAVSAAIDRGIPLTQQSDIARAFAALAASLTENDIEVKRTARSLFRTVS